MKAVPPLSLFVTWSAMFCFFVKISSSDLEIPTWSCQEHHRDLICHTSEIPGQCWWDHFDLWLKRGRLPHLGRSDPSFEILPPGGNSRLGPVHCFLRHLISDLILTIQVLYKAVRIWSHWQMTDLYSGRLIFPRPKGKNRDNPLAVDPHIVTIIYECKNFSFFAEWLLKSTLQLE